MKHESHMYELSESHHEQTGFYTLAEWSAYELGREHEQRVIIQFIKDWDGNTNSAAGQILNDKLKSLKS